MDSLELILFHIVTKSSCDPFPLLFSLYLFTWYNRALVASLVLQTAIDDSSTHFWVGHQPVCCIKAIFFFIANVVTCLLKYKLTKSHFKCNSFIKMKHTALPQKNKMLFSNKTFLFYNLINLCDPPEHMQNLRCHFS